MGEGDGKMARKHASENPSVMRSLYIPFDLYEKLRETARREGTSINQLIVTAIREYLEKKGG
jgi:predicted HicB family RNase H-like nuclease